jgi:hypothetical protein
MSTATEKNEPPQASDDLPPGAPQVVKDLANGKMTDAAGEVDGLEWLLGKSAPVPFKVPVDYETPQGRVKLVFHMHQLDAKRLDQIDAENRAGDGPFAKLDTLAFNAAVAVEATDKIVSSSGREVSPRSEEFRGGLPSPELAMQLRFKFQPGLLEGLAEQVRQMAGMSSDRVGTAQRVVVEVGKP